MKNSNHKKISAVVLAAGKGTRIGQKLPKALYPIAGKPMLHYTLDTLERIPVSDIKVVVGYRSVDVKASIGERVDYVYQEKQLGTAHAVGQAVYVLPPTTNTVLVINCDDSAFYEPGTLRDFVASHEVNSVPVSMISLELDNPTGLGRIVRDENEGLARIVEEKDASEKERKIGEVNAGCYLFDAAWLRAHIHGLSPSQVTGEYYITDLIGLALTQGHKVNVYKLSNPNEFKQVNTLEELKRAHGSMVGKLTKMHTPRVTVIDVDNTILDTDRLKSEVVGKLFKRATGTLGLKCALEDFEKNYCAQYEGVREEMGYIDVPAVCEKLSAALGLKVDGALEDVLLSLSFDKYVFPETREVLEFLRRWSRLAVFADGDMVYEPVKVAGMKIDGYYHDLYISENKTELWPDLSKIYGLSQILYIDDRVENLEACAKVRPDIMTIWVRQGEYADVKPKNKSFEPDYVVRDLRELLEVLKTKVYGWV